MTPTQPRSRGTVSEFGGDRHVLSTRYLAGSPDDVWADLTDPERLAAWFGAVSPGSGATAVTESAPDAAGRRAWKLTPTIPFGGDDALVCAVDRCDAPVRVEAALSSDAAQRRVWFELVPDEDVTVLTVGVVLAPDEDADPVVAAVEALLDRLVALQDGRDAASVTPSSNRARRRRGPRMG